MKKLLLSVMTLFVMAWPTLAGAMSPEELFDLIKGKNFDEVYELNKKYRGVTVEWEGVVQFLKLGPKGTDWLVGSMEVRPHILAGFTLPKGTQKSVVVGGRYTVTGTIDIFAHEKYGMSVILEKSRLCVGPVKKP